MQSKNVIKFSLLALTAVTTAQTAYSGSSFTLSNRNVSKWRLAISNNETSAGLVVVQWSPWSQCQPHLCFFSLHWWFQACALPSLTFFGQRPLGEYILMVIPFKSQVIMVISWRVGVAHHPLITNNIYWRQIQMEMKSGVRPFLGEQILLVIPFKSQVIMVIS